MSTKFESPVDIDLGTNPGRINFNTVEEARNWLKLEQDVWGEELLSSSELRPLTAIISRIIQTQRTKISSVESAITRYESESSESTHNAVVAAFKMYLQGEVLHSTSLVGRKAVELISSAESLKEKTEALTFLGTAIGQAATVDDFRHHINYPADYVAIISGVAKYQDYVTFGEGEIVDRFEEYTRENRGGWERQLALHQNEHFDAVEVIKEKEKKITEEHGRQETEFNELKKSYQSKFSELEEFYKEGLRTEAPVKYWRSKATRHVWFGGFMLTLFVAGCSLAAIYGFNLGSEFSSIVQESGAVSITDSTQSESTSSLLQLAFSKFLVLLIPGFFAVWVLRILLKVALSNLAIADDARHRVTMVETFLSLMEHTDKLDESDRILMLQALFRPIPGSNDDDTGPPNWFDVMMTQVKGKKN